MPDQNIIYSVNGDKFDDLNVKFTLRKENGVVPGTPSDTKAPLVGFSQFWSVDFSPTLLDINCKIIVLLSSYHQMLG